MCWWNERQQSERAAEWRIWEYGTKKWVIGRVERKLNWEGNTGVGTWGKMWEVTLVIHELVRTCLGWTLTQNCIWNKKASSETWLDKNVGGSGTTVAQNQGQQCGERLTQRDRKKMKGEKLGWAVRHAPKVQNMHFSLARSRHQTASSILDGSPLVLCLTQNGTHTEGTGLYRAIFLLHFTLCGSRRELFWWKWRNRWHLNQGGRKLKGLFKHM